MPITPLRQLLYSLGDNHSMGISNLRLKTVVSLALVFMLRPSDIAPRTVKLNKDLGTVEKRIFSTSQVQLTLDSITITFHGIKNDTSRSGFQVTLPSAESDVLDPVQTLATYIERTTSHRAQAQGSPVFLTLQPEYRTISADTVRNILDTTINMAGLAGMGFSAKSFRPTGATYAVVLGYDPELVMRIGRWKMRSVFFEHYIHSQVPKDYTSSLLAHD